MSHAHTSLSLSHLSHAWPDGTFTLHDADAAFSSCRTGIIGANGSGKTTLLRVLCGELLPTSGSVARSGEVSYLPQNLSLRIETTVADLLGVRDTLDALRVIERGETREELFDTVGDCWDIEARSQHALDAVGVGRISLERRVDQLSGGETTLIALAGVLLAAPPIVLLDEPTNNLDRRAREFVYRAVRAWKGALLVVSHDVELLNLMDDTAELHQGKLSIFGGNYTAYREHLTEQQEAAQRCLRDARSKLAVEKRQRREAEVKLARRNRYARNDFVNKRRPKAVMNQRKTEAQVSRGKLRHQSEQKISAAETVVAERAAEIRDDAHIRITLPDPRVPAGRRLAQLRDGRQSFSLQGPERTALVGANGVGKTRLLETLVHNREPVGQLHAERLTDRIGYLPQRLSVLDDQASVLDNLRAVAVSATERALRAGLARFLLRGDAVERCVSQLSGGERFRVTLARLLLADPPQQLLILDEPTNNLDFDSIDALVTALSEYRGGVLVVSHDDVFLERLGVERRLVLESHGALEEEILTLPRGDAA